MLETTVFPKTSRISRPFRVSLYLCLCAIAVAGIAHGILNFIRRPVVPSAVQPYPGASPVWNLGPLGVVKLAVEDTVSYPLNGSDANARWESMMPRGGGIVRVGPDRQPYMLSIFHQLKCLDILRRFHVAAVEGHDSGLDAHARHCLNYLRVMVLCRSDLRLESVQDPDGTHAVDLYGDLTCYDWTQVYARVEENENEK
ncbi:hypothetical protein B0H19DRAFT_1001692 [Mycena capillaripes]|nr:hypothetical protein B0H19DRAFT_1001692 [Mycena capillaripes]